MGLRFDRPPFDNSRPPTTIQRLWGNLFLALWHLTQDNGRGIGKTWFWANVIGFIEVQDPQVREEIRNLKYGRVSK